MAYIVVGQNENAILSLSNYLERNPSDLDALWFRSATFIALERYEEAAQDAKNHIKVSPTDFDGYKLLAQIYIERLF